MSDMRLKLALAAFIGASLLGKMTVGTGHEKDHDADGKMTVGTDHERDHDADGNVTVGTDQARDHDVANIDGPTVLITDLVANASILADRDALVHVAPVVDPNLVNPWGVSESAGPSGSPFWVSNHNQGVSTLYTSTGSTVSLVVSIPAPGDPLNPSGSPTGTVFNVSVAFNGFEISGVDKNGNPAAAPAVFLIATEDGTIVGWNPRSIPGVLIPTRREPTASSRSTNPRIRA